jgi:hypothetical protein
MRIVTRADFDGVVCAVLISDALDIRQPVHWVEPNDFKKGAAGIRAGDIVANLPYHPDCALWFDHHATNTVDAPFEGLFRNSPSAARNVFDYFSGRFTRDHSDLVSWADRVDAADFTREQVLRPERFDYVLLSMTISSEGGKDDAYWNLLVRGLKDGDIRRLMTDPVVAERCAGVVRRNSEYAGWLKAYTRVEGRVAVTDFRALEDPPAGNRYLAYCLFPDTVVSVRIRYEDRRRQTVVVNVGHSIFNPGCKVHAGRLLARFEGGGHRGAASARFHASRADDILAEIIATLVKNQPEPR